MFLGHNLENSHCIESMAHTCFTEIFDLHMKSVTASSVAGSSVKVTNKAWFVVQRCVLVRVGGSTVDHRQVVLPMEVDGEPSWFAKEMEYG